jgi:hypothetical protein
MKNALVSRRYAPLFAIPVVLAALLIALAAWGRGPEFALVEGTVTLDGRPLGSVEVIFLPDPERGNPGGPTSTAYTDDQGRYRLYCDKARKEGTILGAHRVCISDITAIAPLGPPQLPGLPGPHGQPGNEAPPRAEKPKLSRVPLRYNDPRQTPFRDVEVKPGAQTFDFNVETGRRK